METWTGGAMLIEATMLSFLVALWISWMSLRGLFRMLPAARLDAVPIGSVARQTVGSARRDAA